MGLILLTQNSGFSPFGNQVEDVFSIYRHSNIKVNSDPHRFPIAAAASSFV